MTVTAINAIGEGPATGANGTEPAPPPTLPAGGASYVTGDNHQLGPRLRGHGHLHIDAGAARRLGGLRRHLQLHRQRRRLNGAETGAIACGATVSTSTSTTASSAPRTAAQVTHNFSITFTADNGVGTVDSARYNGELHRLVAVPAPARFPDPSERPKDFA